ncbi:MAG: LPP20 family lipoprotein [Spirochaetaceae bacterium]|jgi:hypothetical protein|nr:LPP20 family lipoprotein [Spirochaetaceae bacterium]
MALIYGIVIVIFSIHTQALYGQAAKDAPPPKIAAGKNGRPNWVGGPYSAYDKKYYLAYTGSANSRQAAESNAFAALSGHFGQTVKNKIYTTETYGEYVRGGAVEKGGGQSLESTIEVSTHIDRLIGAEIGAVWHDAKTNIHYALAFMDKAKCAALYSTIVNTNAARIARLLVTVQEAELASVAALYEAAQIADANEIFAAVLYLLGGANLSGVRKTGDDYRQMAREYAKSIPVYISVDGDQSGRLKSAFTSALGDLGFISGDASSRYQLDVQYTVNPLVLENQKNIFVRYELTANLRDSQSGATVCSFSENGRAGHISAPEAVQRALRSAESLAKDAYAASLARHLSASQQEQ